MQKSFKEIAINVIEKEIEGLKTLEKVFDEKFTKAVNLISCLEGKLIVSGMGKSGYIAQKIAATLSSTGTPAFFIHPSEASHGDLGVITKKDAVLLLSNSGETPELKDIITYSKNSGISLLAIVRNEKSQLNELADICFVLPDVKEANDVKAPTTSTTMMLAFGDALAVTLLEKKGFKKEDFSLFHPGGKLGKEFIKIESIMRKGDLIPSVKANATVRKAIVEITKKGLGIVAVIDEAEKILGVISDGDLRRNLGLDLLEKKASDIMTKNPITINKATLAISALKIMQGEKRITSLFITNEKGFVEGVTHLHDLLSAGII